MSYLLVTLAVGAGFAFLVIIGNWIGEAFRRGIVAEDRRIALEALIRLQREQTEELLKEKTVEDVARDLDAGEF